MPRRHHGSSSLTLTASVSTAGRAWRVKWANAGWVGIDAVPEGESLLVRVAPDETGRFRIRELHLNDTGEPVSALRLRSIKLGAIEALLNLAEEREIIRERYDLPLPAPVGPDQFFDLLPSRPVSPTQHAKSGVGKTRAVGGGTAQKPRRLEAPAGRGYPDSFYDDVAEAYREALRRHERPVKAIADAAGVQRTTAARWVKEARRRGRLGKTQQGKAGDIAPPETKGASHAS